MTNLKQRANKVDFLNWENTSFASKKRVKDLGCNIIKHMPCQTQQYAIVDFDPVKYTENFKVFKATLAVFIVNNFNCVCQPQKAYVITDKQGCILFMEPHYYISKENNPQKITDTKFVSFNNKQTVEIAPSLKEEFDSLRRFTRALKAAEIQK